MVWKVRARNAFIRGPWFGLFLVWVSHAIIVSVHKRWGDKVIRGGKSLVLAGSDGMDGVCWMLGYCWLKMKACQLGSSLPNGR